MPMWNPKNFTINFNRSDRNAERSLISYIDNQFAYLFKRVIGTKINIYDGSGYDFDINLDDSQGLCPLVSILHSTQPLTNILEYRSLPPILRFTVINATLDTDFLEIVIPYTAPTDWWHEITTLEYFIQEISMQFQRIQTILKYNDGVNPPWDEIYDNFPLTESGATLLSSSHRYSPANYYVLVKAGLVKIIIRFIGGTSIFTGVEGIIIHDILSKGQYNFFFPIIDIGGGQTIYGTLGLTGALLQTELSGALTDGVPTDTEIDTITGSTPAGVGAGWKCTIKDTTGQD